jgi:cytochrome c-type biogenesis protein
MVQILFAVLAGILTVGAPCILPLLPILLGASVGQTSKSRPLFITIGFVVTFSLAALLLSYLVTTLNFSPDTLRNIAFGLFMVWPTPFEKLSLHLGKYINKANEIGTQAGTGNFGGLILGVMLGIIWTPCAGPVLGSILTLIATQVDIARATILLVAYAIGAGIPMLVVAYGGQIVTTRVRLLARYATRIQQAFGVLILALAIAMYFNYDIVIQAKILEFYDFPTYEQMLFD